MGKSIKIKGNMLQASSNGVLIQHLIVSYLHQNPFQSIFTFIINVVIEECKTQIIE